MKKQKFMSHMKGQDKTRKTTKFEEIIAENFLNIRKEIVI